MNWIKQAIFEESLNKNVFAANEKKSISYEQLPQAYERISLQLEEEGLQPGELWLFICNSSPDAAQAILCFLGFGLNILPMTAHDYNKSQMILNELNVNGVLQLNDQHNGANFLKIKKFKKKENLNCPQGSIKVLTSGSTGKAKLVTLGPDVMLERAQIETEIFNIQTGSKILGVMSFSHELGITQIFSSLLSKSTLYVVNSLFPKDVIAYIEQIKCHGIVATPFFWERVIGQTASCNHKLNWLSISGGILSASGHRDVNKLFKPKKIIRTYGQTETGRSLYNDNPDFDVPNDLGIPVPGVQIELLPCKEGKSNQGELIHKGKGIYSQPDKTKEVKTGDIFELSPEGHYLFLGRVDSMIKRFDLRIYPEEVEKEIHLIGLVNRIVVLVDKQKNQWGQSGRILAFVELKTGVLENDFEKQVKTNLSRVKVPDKYIYVDLWPKTHSEKIDKQALIKMVEEREEYN